LEEKKKQHSKPHDSLREQVLEEKIDANEDNRKNGIFIKKTSRKIKTHI